MRLIIVLLVFAILGVALVGESRASDDPPAFGTANIDTSAFADDCQPVPQIAQWIDLVPGINEIDLNRDGTDDLVIKSYRENHNDHSYWAYKFDMRKPPDPEARMRYELTHVPLELEQRIPGSDNSRTEELSNILTKGDPERPSHNIELFRDPEGTIYALYAKPHMCAIRDHPCRFFIHTLRFIVNLVGGFGSFHFYFDSVDDWVTDAVYGDAQTAIRAAYPDKATRVWCYYVPDLTRPEYREAYR